MESTLEFVVLGASGISDNSLLMAERSAEMYVEYILLLQKLKYLEEVVISIWDCGGKIFGMIT